MSAGEDGLRVHPASWPESNQECFENHENGGVTYRVISPPLCLFRKTRRKDLVTFAFLPY